jgi:heavy metal translocating P-type ATPase
LKKLLKKFAVFFKEYKQFGFVIVSVIVAFALQLIGLNTAANIVLAASAFIMLVPLVWGMIQDIRVGTYGVDILAATAIIAAVLFREYWTAMIIVLMLTGGETLEDYAEQRAQYELTALLERAPQKAHLLRGNKEIDVPVSKVQIGDKLIIRPGEVIPVDAVIISGISDIDESSLTGESLPVNKTVGQDILSGAINIDGALTVKSLKSAEDSQFNQIIKLVKAAQSSKAPFVRMADRYSIPFTLMAFTIALGAWALSGESLRFLQVLVVATPCPLILGAPIALVSGMSRAAKHGIIIKNGSALEQLARAKTLGFDKTGTLTKGLPTVKNIKTYGTFKREEIIRVAASLEQNSNHVLASAILNIAKEEDIKLTKAKHVKEIAGKGLSSHLSGKDVLVGRFSLLQQENIKLPTKFDDSKISDTAAYIAIDGALAGIITFGDELRPETKTTLEKINKLGIKHLLMVTGDNQRTADTIAKQLGIETVVADALPGDKLIAMENAAHRPVGFVGDGVNDAPVLTAADVGIALGARGSTAASESADVVIMLDNIEQVAVGVDIAKRTIRIARQAILTGIILSTILMFIFATGKFAPIYGAAIQELVDVVVIVYALRAHGSWKKPKLVTNNKIAYAT